MPKQNPVRGCMHLQHKLDIHTLWYSHTILSCTSEWSISMEVSFHLFSVKTMILFLIKLHWNKVSCSTESFILLIKGYCQCYLFINVHLSCGSTMIQLVTCVAKTNTSIVENALTAGRLYLLCNRFLGHLRPSLDTSISLF